jgi:hypothetical protein
MVAFNSPVDAIMPHLWRRLYVPRRQSASSRCSDSPPPCVYASSGTRIVEGDEAVFQKFRFVLLVGKNL